MAIFASEVEGFVCQKHLIFLINSTFFSNIFYSIRFILFAFNVEASVANSNYFQHFRFYFAIILKTAIFILFRNRMYQVVKIKSIISLN